MTQDSAPHKLWNWFIQSKAYHLPLWVIYEVASGLFYSRDTMHLDWQTVLVMAGYILSHASVAYLNIYYGIPRFLKKQRYFAFASIFLLSIALSPIFIVLSFAIGFEFNLEALVTFFSDKRWIPAIYGSTFSTVILVIVLKMTKEWFTEQQRNRHLEKEKLETELKFLRSQFNPHFLFNTINSIFFLIHKDQDKASESLAKFSDLLRYQLYECNEAQISLEKELGYLKNFVELEKLRQESSLSVVLNHHIPNMAGVQIAPFILMPFIENAFKHVNGNETGNSFIHIEISLVGNILSFCVENTHQASIAQSAEEKKYSGIGLTNVKRRLELLYPTKHKLDTNGEGDNFIVNLNLELC